MKAAGKWFGILVLGSVLFVSVAIAAPDKPAGGISTLPTPWIVTHRGGALLWPEETIEAYEASTATGNPFVEVDGWLLTDGSVGLLHDDTLERVTNGKGKTNQLSAAQWSKLRIDGRRLLGDGWGSYHAPFFDEVLARFGNRSIIFAESKGPGSDVAVVDKLKAFHISKDFVIFNSFSAEHMHAGLRAGYNVCLNLRDMSNTPEHLKKAGYWGVSCPYPVTEEYIKGLKRVGLKVIGYPVDRHFQRDQFLAWGADGFGTDDPLYQSLDQKYRRNTDPYSTQRFGPGMLEAQRGGRGYFIPPDKWAIDVSLEDKYKGCLQGWMCPIGGREIAPEWSMEFSITFGPSLKAGRWASVAIFTTDAAFDNDGAPVAPLAGYHILFFNTGGIGILRFDGKSRSQPVSVKSSKGKPITEGETVRYRITTNPDTMKVERLDGTSVVEASDAIYRGAYVTFGAKGQRADFSNVNLTVP